LIHRARIIIGEGGSWRGIGDTGHDKTSGKYRVGIFRIVTRKAIRDSGFVVIFEFGLNSNVKDAVHLCYPNDLNAARISSLDEYVNP
jgi:hypothetical protein